VLLFTISVVFFLSAFEMNNQRAEQRQLALYTYSNFQRILYELRKNDNRIGGELSRLRLQSEELRHKGIAKARIAVDLPVPRFLSSVRLSQSGNFFMEKAVRSSSKGSFHARGHQHRSREGRAWPFAIKLIAAISQRIAIDSGLVPRP